MGGEGGDGGDGGDGGSSGSPGSDDVDGKLLYSDGYPGGWRYYKVPMPYGTTMIVGAVTHACEAQGLWSVCLGRGCHYNSRGCRVTPLGNDCDNPMAGLSKQVCLTEDARDCDELERMFTDHKTGFGGGTSGRGACGIVDGIWCASGDKFISGVDKQLYAYCVK